MKRFVFVLLAALLIVSPVFANGTQETTKEDDGVKIGVIYTIAGLGGASFNDVIHEGCQRAVADFGVKYEYVEPSTIADEETVMEEMCASGEYALIICSLHSCRKVSSAELLLYRCKRGSSKHCKL